MRYTNPRTLLFTFIGHRRFGLNREKAIFDPWLRNP